MNYTGNTLGCFTKIVAKRTRLQCSHYKQYTHLNTGHQNAKIQQNDPTWKKLTTLQPYDDVHFEKWFLLMIYIDSNRELLAMTLSPALSKWSDAIVICMPLQYTYLHGFCKPLALGNEELILKMEFPLRIKSFQFHRVRRQFEIPYDPTDR